MGIAWAAEETLRDIKGPVALQGNVLPVLLALAILAVIALLAWLLLENRKNLKPVTAVPARPAHQIALELLRRLKEKDLVGQGRLKEYYSEISDIVRRYLESRFSLNAPEMTTEEFLAYARDRECFSSGHKSLLRDFLRACDLVKFAKYTPGKGDIEAIYAGAVDFVEQTKEEAGKC